MTVACQTPAPIAKAPVARGQATFGESRFLAPVGDLALRVCGGEHDGQLLKIHSAKCTIGSGVGCTLRLRGCGVQSLACWVLRGPAGTIVRRMHGPATLNGAGFEESALRPGDRLRIGGVELEVVNCQQPAAIPVPLFPPMEPASGEVAGLKAEVAKLQDRAARLEAECRQGFEASIMAAERADQLRDALSAAHEQLESLSCDLQTAQDTVSQQTEELAGKHREFDQLHASQRELVGKLEEANKRASSTVQSDDANRRELEALRHSQEALTQQCSQLAQERDVLTQERNSLVRERDDLTQQRDSLLRERDALILEGRSAVQARDAATRLQATLTQERDALLRERDTQGQERANLLQERESLLRDRDTAAAERDALTHERDLLIQEREALAQDRALIEQQKNAAAAETTAARAENQAQQEQYREERTLLERRLAQRDAEIESLRSSSAAQNGAMTVAMNELTQTQVGLREELAQRCAELEAQLARQCGEAEAMARKFAAESVQRDTREQALASDLEAKCRELGDNQQQLAALQQSNAAHSELQTREQELSAQRAQIEQDLATQRDRIAQELAAQRQQLEQELAGGRTRLDEELAEQRSRLEQQAAAVTQKEQELSAAKSALEAQATQFTQSREQWELEREEFVLQKQELCDAQEQLQSERLNLEQQKEWLLAAQQQHTELSTAESKLREQAAVIETELLEATQRLAEIERLRDELLAERGRLAQREQALNEREAGLASQAVVLQEAANRPELAAAIPEVAAAPKHEPVSAQEAPVAASESLQCSEPTNEEPVANVASPHEAMDEAQTRGAAQASDLPVQFTAVWTPEQLEALNIHDKEQAQESTSPREPDAQPQFDQQQADPQADAPANVSDSGEVDALLGRLVRAGLWRKDEQEAQPETAEHTGSPQSFFSGPAHEPSPEADAAPAWADYPAAGVQKVAAPLTPPTLLDGEALAGHAALQAAAMSGPDDEESIESYMERLMKRVRGDGPGTDPSRPSGSIARELAQPSAPEPVAMLLEEPAEESDYSPRRTAPELATNLSAMRELANTAARSAIDQHVRQHTGKQATGKLLGACLTVAASSVVGYWAIRALSLPAAVAALIGASAGTYWTWVAFKRLATLRRINLQAAATLRAGDQGISHAPLQAESRSFVARPSVPHNPDT